MKRSIKLPVLALVLVILSTLTGALAASGAEPVAISKRNFPDAAFRKYLSKYWDINEDGMLSESEIRNVEEMNLTGHGTCPGLKTLSGLWRFTELKQLSVFGTDLEVLNVSGNRKLERLDCTSCEYLCEINVSRCKSLKTISVSLCHDLAAIKGLSACKLLNELKCLNGSLASLNLSKNPVLTYLEVSGNKLSRLDVSKNALLTHIGCSDNRLTKLDISRNSQLTSLSCSGNRLTKLNTGNNRNLESIYCDDNRIAKLDLRNNRLLDRLYCEGNKLTDLNLNNNRKLRLAGISASVKKLNIAKCGNLLKMVKNNNRTDATDLKNRPAVHWEGWVANDLYELRVGPATKVVNGSKVLYNGGK